MIRRIGGLVTILVVLVCSPCLAQLRPDIPFHVPNLPGPPILLTPEVASPPSPPVLVEPTTPQDLAVPQRGIPDIFPPAEPFPGNMLDLQADTVRITDVDGEQVANATGNVTATYKDIVVTSGVGTYDSRTQTAVFEQNVVIRIQGQTIRGQRLTINLANRQYTVEGPSTTLPPSLFVAGVVAPVYLRGGSVTGVGRRRLIATDTVFTTCNLEEPHYEIIGRQVLIFPEQKIVIRKAEFYALGRRIFSIPRLVIPFRRVRDRSNLVPQVGQSAEEGVFVKAAYNYSGSARETGLFKLDLMSKKGVGTGIEQTYNLAKAAGGVYLYNLFDRTLGTQTFTGHVDHRQNIAGIDARLTSDYRQSSYLYAPQATSWGTNLALERNTRGANTALAIRRDLETGFGRFTTLTSSLQHRQQFNQTTSGLFAFDYSSFDQPVTTETGTTTATQGQLVSRGAVAKTFKLFDLGVNATKITDLSDEAFIGRGFSGIERLPEVEINSDTTRLGRPLPYNIPLRLGFVAGRYRELPDGADSNRFFLQVDSSAQRYNLSQRLALTAGAGFRQFVYGSDAAQYVIDTSEELTYAIGRNSAAGLGYRYMDPRGFSPFRFDQISRYNMLNGRLDLQESERFKLGVVTGYNFSQNFDKWQDISIRALVSPSERVALFTSTGYDPNRGQWRSLLNQFRLRLPGRLALDVGTRYDIPTGRWGSIKTAFDIQAGSKWRIQGFTGYNGFTRSFDYRNFRIQRDLHCWVASLTYSDRSGIFRDKQIMLNLSIKAFPIFDRFSLGQFGQPLDTSVGQIY